MIHSNLTSILETTLIYFIDICESQIYGLKIPMIWSNRIILKCYWYNIIFFKNQYCWVNELLPHQPTSSLTQMWRKGNILYCNYCHCSQIVIIIYINSIFINEILLSCSKKQLLLSKLFLS